MKQAHAVLGSVCLGSLVGALLGCSSAWGRSLELPEELRKDASVYAATAEHQSFDTEAPRQRVTFERKQGRGTHCAKVFSVWGKLGRSEVNVEHEAGVKTVVARSTDHLSAGSAGHEPLVLHAMFERVTAEAGERWTEAEVGEGTFLIGGQSVGSFRSEGGVIHVSLNSVAGEVSGETADYVVIAQPYRRQYLVKTGQRTLLFAAVDWSHWGFGERGFQVVVADKLSCDRQEEIINLFLLAKVLSGA